MTASPAIQPLPDPGSLEQLVDGRERTPAKLVFLDVETTGLDPDRHEIWEIGLIVGSEERHWFLAVDLERADGTALRVSGYYERHPSTAEVWDPHDPKTVATELAKLTAGAHLVGVNPAFDATFLGRFIRAHGQVPTWHYHLIDVLPLIAGRYKIPPPWESKDLSAAVHIPPPEGDDRHTALGDARWARAMYEAIMAPAEESFTPFAGEGP